MGKRIEGFEEIAGTQVRELTTRLNAREIDYWVDLGILLGYIREGGPIGWDDDIELGIWAKDLDDCIEYAEGLDGYSVYTKSYKDLIACVGLSPTYDDRVGVNVLVFYEGDEYAYSVSQRRVGSGLPLARLHSAYHWYVHRNSIMDPVANNLTEIRTRRVPKRFYKELVFREEFQFYVPGSVEEYLEHRYGDWRTPDREYSFWEDSGAIVDARPEELVDIDTLTPGSVDSSRQ